MEKTINTRAERKEEQMLFQITSVHVKKAITTPRHPHSCQPRELKNCRSDLKWIYNRCLFSVIEISSSRLCFQAFQHISDSYKFTSKKPKQQLSNTKAEILMKSHDSFKEDTKSHKICYKNMKLGCTVSLNHSVRICVVRYIPLPIYSSAQITENWK